MGKSRIAKIGIVRRTGVASDMRDVFYVSIDEARKMLEEKYGFLIDKQEAERIKAKKTTR